MMGFPHPKTPKPPMSTTPQKPKHPKASLYLLRKLFDGLARFTDLEQRIVDLPTPQERGDAFEVFVEAYLSTQALHQAKTVWPFSAIPLAIKDRFALGQSDVGADGVFETHLGDYHAYQAKFRTDRPSLTWDELSTFMGLTDQIAERVVITNCDELSTVLSDRRGFYAIRGTDLDRLQAEDFEAIRNWLAGAIVAYRRKTPLPRQQDALDAIVQTLSEHDRATILMPCGTGKTLVALWAAEQLGSKKILVLVPSLALISQTLHAWLKETHWHNPSFLCVCSDPTVTSRAEDTLALHQADVDFPVTTDCEAVQTFLERETEGVKVIFSTYQSARVVAAGMGETERVDFGIFDEAHKTAGREEAQFSFALQDANLPISKRLFMTATPRHYRVRKPNKEGEAKLVYSMDVPDVYGPVAYRLSFAQAVQEKMICDYKVLISVVTTTMVNNELLRSGTVFIAGGAIKARQVANQLAVKDALNKYKIGKVISFHKSVAAAASFTANGPEGIGEHVPGLAAFHVNGGMSAGKREPILRSFAAGDRTLISNARCLTEGVDVPAVDMVAFLSPKRSRIDIVQATGRAMRKNDATQKIYGYVLLPLFLEERTGESLEEAVTRADFDEIWAVLQALQEHDEVLGETIAHIRDERDIIRGFDDQSFREKVEILAPEVSLDTLRQSITTKLLDALISMRGSWESMFQALIRFKRQHGHCNVEWRHNLDLAYWIIVQRESRLRGSLNDAMVQRLESIGFQWEPQDAAWERMFEALRQFRQQQGHCNVPRKWPKNRNLAAWCERQRRRRLTTDQVRRLKAIGFSWDRPAEISIKPDHEWDSMFEALRQFKQQEGHCNVSPNSPENRKLAIWSEQQRQHRRLLAVNQVQRLEAIGFQWEPHDAEWERMFEALRQFRQQQGHCIVPLKWPDNPQLATWSECQRRSHRRGRLSMYSMKRLEELGFEWDSWEAMFATLLQFIQQHGHCNVSLNNWKHPILGVWVNKQRQDRRRGCLNDERIRRLDEVGFTWTMSIPLRGEPSRATSKVRPAIDWETMFDALVHFKQQYGHCNIEWHFPERKELSKWIERQRLVREIGKLSQERQQRLEDLGFEWSQQATKKAGPHGKKPST